MARHIVLLTEPIHPDGMSYLEQHGVDVRLAADTREETLVAAVDGCEGIITRLARVTARVIDAGRRLKIVVRHGSGVDNIDLEAARARGVAVANVPGANTVSVVEYVMGVMILLARRLRYYEDGLRRGDFSVRGHSLGIDLEGRTLGIVGLGRIGRLLACRAGAGLGMKVVACDPAVSPEVAGQLGVKLVPNHYDVLRVAEVVSLHVPDAPSTRGMVGREAIGMMRPGAILINCARGGVVDERAVAAALAEGKLAGAAFDVFEIEPPLADNPLFGLPNVVLTPHIAGVTRDSLRRLTMGAVTQVVAALGGEAPPHLLS